MFKNIILRNRYINLLNNSKEDGWVKILAGVRRSGKSTIFNMFINELKQQGVNDTQIIHIKMDDEENAHLRNPNILHEYISSNLQKDVMNYIFIDEIQEANEWPRIINSISLKNNVDIYLTGSNARVFIGEQMTYLTGRYVKINVFPLSLDELSDFQKGAHSEDEIYHEWLNTSFPSVVLESNLKYKRLKLIGLKDTVVLKDIAQKGNAMNIDVFNKVIAFIYDNLGKPTSIKKIRDVLNSQGKKISIDAIDNYLSILQSAYLLYDCPRYDLKGKNLLKTNKKYYSVDVGLSKALSGRVTNDVGFDFENFIFLELKKAGYDVFTTYVGADYEIDFVAQKFDGKSLYIQVTNSILDNTTRERETRPFKYVKEVGAKIIVTLDKIKFTFDNCEHLMLSEFLKLIQD